MTVTMEMHEKLETATIPDLRQMAPDDAGWQRVVTQEERHRDLDANLPRDFGPCPDWCTLDHTKMLVGDEIHQELPVRIRDHEREFGAYTVCRTDHLGADGQVKVGTPYLLTFEATDRTELPAARAVLADLTAAVEFLARVSTDVDTAAQVMAEQQAVAEDAQ